jgi:hypothetical protein
MYEVQTAALVAAMPLLLVCLGLKLLQFLLSTCLSYAELAYKENWCDKREVTVMVFNNLWLI